MKLISLTHRIRIALVFLSLALVAPALAQTANTGTLTGAISDQNGAVLAGVQVKMTNEATGEARTVVSQSNGSYTVPLLLPGSYRLEFSKSGFKVAEKTGVRINVTETARLDVRLEVGGVQERMIVTAQVELLQTDSSALGRTTDHVLVTDLPLVSRNYTQIINLSPGIAAEVTQASEFGRGGGGESQGNFRAHGSFGRDNNFQLNGVQINDLQASGAFSGGVAIPNPDAIDEFKVQTGLFDAAFGRNGGANVNVVTKAGGNKFHGTAFEFLRNDALNANEFFRNKTGQGKGVLKQNQFGFTLGGPIKRDKLLFFTSYQGTRQRNGVAGLGVSNSNITSPAFTNDRSRAALGKMFAGRGGFAGGVTILPDGSNISAQALALLNLKLPNGQFAIPSPQTVDPTKDVTVQGFSTFSSPGSFDENQFIANLDFLHTEKSKIWGRFFFADSSQNSPLPPSQFLGAIGVPGFPAIRENEFRNLSLAHSYVFSPRLINQADFGFHRIIAPTIQQELFKWSDVGVKAPSVANQFPSVGVFSSLSLGGNGQSARLSQNHFTVQDALIYTRGRQTLRFGGGLTRTQLNIGQFTFPGGVLFLSWPDFLLGLPGGAPAAGGNGTPFSNILASIDIPGDLDRNWRILDGNAYAQDDIKLTPSFTINLGLRYERLGQLGDTGGRNGGFDISLANPNPPAGGTLAGFLVSENFPGSAPAGVTQLDNRFGIRGRSQNSFGPRIGMAWRLPKTHLLPQMALRGGYGIYYSRATGQPFIQLAAGPPFASARVTQFPLTGGLSFANPFGPELSFPLFQPYSPTTQQALAFLDPDYRSPITQQFSLNLQTDLGGNYLLEVGYVGTRGTQQILSHGLNQARLASPANPIRGETTNTVANILKRVPILGFTSTGLSDIDSSASSWYNGLEVSVTKRLSKGLQFLAAYTFSHAYSNAGTNTFAAGGGVSGNQNDRQANYGRSDFNREHRLVLSYRYQLPSPQRFKPLLGGWSVSGVTTFQSGLPLSFFGQNNNNAFGIGGDRAQLASGCTHADLTTSGSAHSKLDNYFNTSCFARADLTKPLGPTNPAIWPVIGADGRATNFGNSGVGIAFGPDQRNFDLAIIKRTPLHLLGEGGYVEFRTEFFNAFNTTQFNPPDSNVTSSTFGKITSTAVSPRIMQFALKLNF